MADTRQKALHKHVRIAPEQWERLERASQGTPHSPNQILVEFAMEALDRREWPATEVEMRVARASLFTAQARQSGGDQSRSRALLSLRTRTSWGRPLRPGADSYRSARQRALRPPRRARERERQPYRRHHIVSSPCLPAAACGGPGLLDRLAAKLRCLPVSDHAAKFLFITSCCCC